LTSALLTFDGPPIIAVAQPLAAHLLSRFTLFDHLVKELLPRATDPKNGGYNRLLYPYFL
jgi:hypothetical protein